MRKKNYRVENVSGQEVTLCITLLDGSEVTDVLEVGEVVYGVNEDAAGQLVFYSMIGLIKVTEATDEDAKVRWLVEGF